MHYREPSVIAVLNRLVANTWSFGARYKFTRSELESDFTEVPSSVWAAARQQVEADLHEGTLFALFAHPSGFFSRAEINEYYQSAPALPPSDFYQANVFVGYRFPRRRAEVTIGILNLNDTDYRLNPVTPYSELPRERTYVVRLRMDL